MYDELAVDLLILGGGGAGLMAALHAWEKNPRLRIAIAAKGLLGQSGCTRMVQGGYNAVLDPRDSLDLHLQDTIKGGGFINNQELAWALVSDAPGLIRELERRGCFFDRTPDGNVYQKPFAGQSFDRTVHRGDLTGIEIMTRLKDNLFATDIILLDEHRGLELFTDGDGTVTGALLLDVRTGRFLAVSAKATLVATGGGARMYRIAAPSLEKAGDGMAMCYRAGCVMQDMEMYQFHPTGLIAGNSILTGSVLEEGLRGAGGRLTNALGERFMARYDPERMERSTRDVVARAGYMEIQAGRGTPDGAVLLDVSHLGAEYVERAFPGMVERCREIGFDLAREPVKVSPSAHFHMGGARIDVWCHTNLEGLFVAGEDAAGVHGANRLGGNGVAESTVFGARAGDAMAEFVTRRPQPAVRDAQAEDAIVEALQPIGQSGREDIHAIRKEIERLMWDKVGLVRHGGDIQDALAALESLAERAGRASVLPLPEYNLAWQEWLNVRSILTVAKLTALSALTRTESRGSHYRSDYPQRNDREWLCNVTLQRSEGDAPRVWTEPVKFTRLQPG
ncbi:MAG: FAD-binding protein [Chloroflexi bacterium]|nr:FAD-binding protein [Chloroflexota bacterium]